MPGDSVVGRVLGVPPRPAFRAASVVIEGVGLNPTRTAFLGVLERMGARVDVRLVDATGAEPVGTLTVRHATLRPVEIEPAEVPGLIDELPALAALATHGGGLTVTGAGELRVKESDRITALVAGLRALGADVDERPDGFHVAGAPPAARAASPTRPAITGWRWPSPSPRSAPAGDSRILGAEAVAVSYPGFFDTLEGLRA